MAKKKESYRDTWTYTGYTLKPEQVTAIEKLSKMKSSVIALQPGLGKCRHPDDRVQTSIGYVRFKDILPEAPYGITDISHLGIKASTRYGEKQITHIYKESNCVLRSLRLSNGTHFRGTLKHRILCQTDDGRVDWKCIGDIVKGDRVLYSDVDKHRETSACVDGMACEDICYLGMSCNDVFPSRIFEGSHEQRLCFMAGFCRTHMKDRRCLELNPQFTELHKSICDMMDSVGMFYTVLSGGKIVIDEESLFQFKRLRQVLHTDLVSMLCHECKNKAEKTDQLEGYHAETVMGFNDTISDVMDIEVADVHEYFSQGIINHNTIVSLHYANELSKKGVDGFKAPVRCIFAVPKAATHAFERECVTKLNKPYLLLTVKNKDVTWEEVFKNDIIIVEHTYFKQIVPALQKITETFPTYLFIDEAHCLQNDKSELSKSLWTVRQKCLGVFCLTGTPLVNSIEGLYNLYHFTFPRVFPSWFAFRDRYCVTKEREIYMRKKGQAFNPYQQKRIIKEIVGYQNMEELNGILDRLTIKGAKTYDVEYKFLKTVLDPELADAYVSAAHGLLVTKDEKDWGARLHDLQRVVDGNPITDEDGKTLKLPDGFVSNKFNLMADTLKEATERGEACLIYVEYLETVDLVKNFIENRKESLNVNNVHILSGEIPEKTRAEIEVIMQPRDVVIMTSSGTASRNLQKANNLIFFNVPFSIQATIQTCGRICRVDSAYPKQHVYMLEVDGTIDSYKIMLFRDHLALVDQLMGEECRSSVTCDYVEIDRSRMDYIKKSLLWQKGMGKTIKGSGRGVKKKSKGAESIKDDIKGNVSSLDDFLNGDWSLG